MFVVLEGIDGSGKTSVGKEVVRLLRDAGIKARFTFEPSDLPIGRLLRDVLKGGIETDPHTHALLFAADREEHMRMEVLPLVEEGEIVICDRYVYASMAYQGAKGLELDYVWNMNTELPHFREPDLAFLLDVDPVRSLKRTTHREEADIFETPTYLQEVRKNYHLIAKEHDMIIVDAGQEMEKVVRDIHGMILLAIQK